LELHSYFAKNIIFVEPNIETFIHPKISLSTIEEASAAEIKLVLVNHSAFKELPKSYFGEYCVDTVGLLENLV
jgi:hypothetical protein